MAGRAKCELTASVCDVLVKSHLLPEQIGRHCAAMDEEDFTDAFAPFLHAVAQHTTRVSVGVVKRSVETVLGTPRSDAEKFGQCVSSALSWCHSKGLRATSGRKLKDTTVSVILAFADERLKQVQDAIKSGKDDSSDKKRLSGCSSESQGSEQKRPKVPAAAAAEEPAAAVAISISALYGLSTPRTPRPSIPSALASPVSVTASPISIGSSSQEPPAKKVMWFDLNQRIAHRFQAGVQQNGLLKVGPDGFCIAAFANEECVTEVPNLVLECSLKGSKVQKKPAASKKPAAAATSGEEVEEAEATTEPVEEDGKPVCIYIYDHIRIYLYDS